MAPMLCGGAGTVFNDRTSANSGTWAKFHLSPNQPLTVTVNGSVRPVGQTGGGYQYIVHVEFQIIGPDGVTAVGPTSYPGYQENYLPTNAVRTFGSTVRTGWTLPAGWGESDYYIRTDIDHSGIIGHGNVGLDLEWGVSISVGTDPATGDVHDGPNCLPREPEETDTSSAGEPNACGAQPGVDDPVNVVQGNFWQTWSDLAVPGRGPGLGLSRTYSSSRSGTDGAFGYGWSFSYGMSVAVSSGVARVRQENGAVLPFESSAGLWIPPARVNATLTENTGSTNARWVLKRRGTEVFTFNSSGKLVSIADLSGNTTTLTYSGTELATVTDPAGRQLAFTWTGGKVTKVAAPSVVLETGGSSQAMEVNYTYSGGDLQTVTTTNGGVWTYGYASHRMTTIREPRHHSLGGSAPVVENHYDSLGRVDWQEDRLDRRSTLAYAAGQTTSTDPKGNVTVFEHTNGLCTGIVRNPGASQSRWTFEVDPVTLGRTKVTNPNGVVTTAQFNGRGLPVKVTGPKGTTIVTYDPVTALPTSVQDPSFTTTTYTWAPGTDRLTGISRPITPGNDWTTTIAYGDSANPGMPTSLTDARQKVWNATYTANGDLASATDPTGRQTTWTYNAHGWPLTEVAPAGNAAGGIPADHTTKVAYNRSGDVVRVLDPLGAATDYSIDPSGYVLTINDPVPVGQPAEQTGLTWNAAGELTTVTRPGGSTLTTEYWPNGSLKTQRDGANAATSYAYDSQGRLSTITDPGSRVTTFGYDAGGRVVSRNAQSGTCPTSTSVGCVFYEYFSSGELKKIDYTDATPDVTFEYDELGLRTSMVDQAGTSTWTWDSIGRLELAEEPSGTIDYVYTDNGPGPTTIIYPGSKSVTQTYDNAGRQNSVTGWTGGATSFGYDDNSNLTSIDTGASTGNEDTFAFDRANRMTAFTLRKNGATTAGITYTRDPEGMVSGETGTGLASDSYTYGGFDMLATKSSGSYTYDAADNLTGFPDGRKQKFSANNQLCYQATTNTAACTTPPSGATTFSYDARGNRTAKTPATGLATSYGYDLADRLTSATVPLDGDAGQFQTLEPQRIVDTRSGGTNDGTCYSGGTQVTCSRVSAGGTLEVKITGEGGPTGVPSTGVSAVTFNLHAYNPAGTGYAKVYPSGVPEPSGVRSLSFTGTETASNRVTTAVGDNGRIKIYVGSAATDLFIDVNGWYATPTGGTANGEFVPITPARAVDTQLTASTVKDVQITGQAGIPDITVGPPVSAVAVNITVHDPTAGGFVKAYRDGTDVDMSPLRTLSFESGVTTSVSADLKLNPTNGRLSLFSDKAVRVTVDVVGYWTDNEGDRARFVPVDPTRLLNTVSGAGSCSPDCGRISSQETITVDVAGQAGLPPSGIQAVVLNVTTVNATGAGGAVYVWASGTSKPNQRTLAAEPNRLISNSATVKVGSDGKIKVYADQDSGGADVYLDVQGYYTTHSTWQYTYTGDGLRRSKKSFDGTTTTYVWDRSKGLPLLAAETIDAPATSNDRTIRYLYDPSGLVLADITQPSSGAETLRWYHHDQLGSTRALTDASGTTIGTFNYTPFGELASSTGSAVTPLGWAGEYADAETGLVYLRARYYDPSTAQFLSRDPLEFLTRAAFQYTYNNPVNLVDRSGMWPVLVIGAGAGFLTGLANQVARHGFDIGAYDGRALVVSTFAGAVAGPFASKSLVLGGGVGGGLSNYLTQRFISPSGDVDLNQVVIAFALGGLFGGVFKSRAKSPDTQSVHQFFNVVWGVLSGFLAPTVDGFLERLFGVDPASSAEAPC